MPYLSEMVGKTVTDANGERIGRLEDLIAASRGGMAPPQIVALAVKHGSELLLIPYDEAAVLLAPAIPLLHPVQNIIPYQPGENDLYLARDVLDKQIIDTDGVRVVRVNDLELARVNGHFLRRQRGHRGVGAATPPGSGQADRKGGRPPGAQALLRQHPWDAVELLPGNQPMRLKVSE